MSDATGPALVVTRHGGIDVLAVEHRPAPEPGAGEVLVEVAAAGVNFIDVYQREGVYPTTPPFVSGNEGAGTVVAVGEGVEGFQSATGWPGRRAWGALRRSPRCRHPGSCSCPTGSTSRRRPPSCSRASPRTTSPTSTYAVAPGDVALVHAAAGGVGQLLVQLVRARGGTVVATAGGPEKCETARAVGAEHVIDYRAVDDLADEVRRVTGGRGVDVAYDGVGKDTFDASLASLRPRGMLVLFGGPAARCPRSTSSG